MARLLHWLIIYQNYKLGLNLAFIAVQQAIREQTHGSH
jgi:hypothetical protein